MKKYHFHHSACIEIGANDVIIIRCYQKIPLWRI